MKEWALITGATAGIGQELAREFAAGGFNLVLVARTEARLEQVAAELRGVHPIEVRTQPKDLAQPEAAAELFAALQSVPIAALVNNAGFGIYGPFASTELARHQALMQVNMTALVELTHRFLQPMLARGQGRILNVASTAAFQPGPAVNLYYASKAFVYSFSYALARELEGSGVTVTALCPGTTQTEFFARAGMTLRRGWPVMTASAVAKAGFRGMMRGKRVVIPGLANQVASFFAKRLPPRLTTAVVRRLHQRVGFFCL